jgi:putative nucleotidyltransferase-like protein
MTNDQLWQRIEGAVANIRNRLERACAALDAASVPHAVVGGNAVAVWVGLVDQGAIRNTRDIDILLRRADLDRATKALADAGFVPTKTFGVTMFLDGPDAKPSESIHILFAGERVQDNYLVPSPDVDDAERPTSFAVLALESLVQMKLTSYRLKDRVHIQDLIGVGLIDTSWLSRFPPELAERLRELLDNPNA